MWTVEYIVLWSTSNDGLGLVLSFKGTHVPVLQSYPVGDNRLYLLGGRQSVKPLSSGPGSEHCLSGGSQ